MELRTIEHVYKALLSLYNTELLNTLARACLDLVEGLLAHVQVQGTQRSDSGVRSRS